MACNTALSSIACKQRALQLPPPAARCVLVPPPVPRAPAGLLPRSTTGSLLPCSSLRGTSLATRPVAQHAVGRHQVVARASWGRGNSGPDVADRVIAALPYLVPLLDGIRYGKFFLVQYPQFGAVLLPLDPIIRLYYSFPLAGLIVFFGIYLGIINNTNFSRYVRFNAMQAVLLDIILILPSLLEGVFRPPIDGPGLQLYISGYNTIFIFLFACVAYGVGACVLGQTAHLPLVADAADAQVR